DGRREDAAILISTSGTTGPPKRVALSRDSWLGTMSGRTGDTLGIQYSPLAHIAGALAISRAAVLGGRVVVLEKFTVERWLDAVRRHRPTSVGLPPTMMRMVMNAAPDRAGLESVQVVSSGQAPVDWDLARQFEEKYDVI